MRNDGIVFCQHILLSFTITCLTVTVKYIHLSKKKRVCATKKHSLRGAHKKTFASLAPLPLLPLQLGSLYHPLLQVARAAQGAGVNSWSLPLDYKLARRLDFDPPALWGLPRLTNRFPLSFLKIAKSAYKAAICQVLGRC